MRNYRRLMIAFLLAPLTVALLFALAFRDAGALFVTALYTYPLALVGALIGYATLRALAWLRAWTLILAGLILGALFGWWFSGGLHARVPFVQTLGNAILCGVYGALTALVFWLIAFARLRAKDSSTIHEPSRPVKPD